MGIEAIGATLTFAAASVGTIVGFSTPENIRKKFENTGLGDTREQFAPSAMHVGQVASYVIRYDPEAKPVSMDDAGVWVLTLPKQTSGSAAGETQTYTGFVERIGSLEGDVDGAEGLTQDFDVQLTTENVIVDEA